MRSVFNQNWKVCRQTRVPHIWPVVPHGVPPGEFGALCVCSALCVSMLSCVRICVSMLCSACGRTYVCLCCCVCGCVCASMPCSVCPCCAACASLCRAPGVPAHGVPCVWVRLRVSVPCSVCPCCPACRSVGLCCGLGVRAQVRMCLCCVVCVFVCVCASVPCSVCPCGVTCTEAMGIDFQWHAVADPKLAAQQFVKHNFPAVKHIFKSATDLSDGCAERMLCTAYHMKCSFTPTTRPAMVTAGLPCQPVSQQSRASGAPREHRFFKVIMELVTYLRVRRPYGFMFEEVLTILRKDAKTGKRWIDILLESAADLGYACEAVKTSCAAWSLVPRDRISPTFCHIIRGGGAEGRRGAGQPGGHGEQ